MSIIKFKLTCTFLLKVHGCVNFLKVKVENEKSSWLQFDLFTLIQSNINFWNVENKRMNLTIKQLYALLLNYKFISLKIHKRHCLCFFLLPRNKSCSMDWDFLYVLCYMFYAICNAIHIFKGRVEYKKGKLCMYNN